MKSLKVVLLIAAVITMSGCAGRKNEKNPEKVQVTRSTVSAYVVSTGVVSPRNRIEIKPPVAGRVETVLVKEGQNVRRGQILAWMSSSERAALLDSARAKGPEEVKHWENVYRKAPITAPINGFIIKRNVEPGQTIMSSDPLLVMADTLIVNARVDETDLARIRLKQEAGIALDAYPDIKIPGFVEHIAYESEVVNNVNMYQVFVFPRAVSNLLRSGMSATVSFLTGEKKDVLTLPANAVKKIRNSSYVFMESQGNGYQPQKIETGLESGEQVEIMAGITDDAVVLIPTKQMLLDLAQMNNPRRPPAFGIFGGGTGRRRQ